jgi:hypothetical protein
MPTFHVSGQNAAGATIEFVLQAENRSEAKKAAAAKEISRVREIELIASQASE